MSRRASILKALAAKIAEIDGTGKFKTNLSGNAIPKLVFWDQCYDFPCVYMSPGTESREYMPSAFTWAYLNISLKLYCKGEYSQQQLEDLLEDVEHVIDANRVLVYDTTNNYETTEMLISSITTDEGLLAPYAIGEINLQVRYAIMQS